MRRPAVIAVLALATVLTGCIDEGAPKLPPYDQFYFPVAVHHVDSPGTEGALYVASANFDYRYDFGSVHAVDVASLGLPPLGTAACDASDGGTCEVARFEDLHLRPDAGDMVLIDAFADLRMGAYPLPGGGTRLFVPTRDEGDRVHVVDMDVPANPDRAMCLGPGEVFANDCSFSSPSLSAAEFQNEGHPRGITPAGVAVDATTGRVFVTHRFPANDPLGSVENPEAYLVQLDANAPTAATAVFNPIGFTGATAVALGTRYAYVVGFPNPYTSRPELVRAVDLTNPARQASLELDQQFESVDGRDVALSSDGRRLFVLSRFPDMLWVVELLDATSDAPRFNVVGMVKFGKGDDPNRMVVVPRGPGLGDAVVITCTESNALFIYDEDGGNVHGGKYDFGRQPSGISVDLQGTGARFFVTHFADGQIGVIDMPNVATPWEVVPVARIGKPQHCLLEEGGKGCN